MGTVANKGEVITKLGARCRALGALGCFLKNAFAGGGTVRWYLVGDIAALVPSGSGAFLFALRHRLCLRSIHFLAFVAGGS